MVYLYLIIACLSLIIVSLSIAYTYTECQTCPVCPICKTETCPECPKFPECPQQQTFALLTNYKYPNLKPEVPHYRLTQLPWDTPLLNVTSSIGLGGDISQTMDTDTLTKRGVKLVGDWQDNMCKKGYYGGVVFPAFSDDGLNHVVCVKNPLTPDSEIETHVLAQQANDGDFINAMSYL